MRLMVVGVLLVGLWMSAPPEWRWQPNAIPLFLRPVTGIAVAITIVASLANLLFGSSLSRYTNEFEEWCSDRLAAKYIRKLKIDNGL